ncbi:MAG: tetratricopeptide repeat protein, partial [Pikeienuella sp.]
VALFAISQGDNQGALATYDEQITGVQPAYSQDQINEISLLARLELAGCDVGNRWEGIADRMATRVGDFVSPFLTMQYLYALARAGREEASVLMRNLDEVCAAPNGWSTSIWRDAALPACQGMMAHAKGNWAEAADQLGTALPHLWRGGGSHAQRDLFNQIHLDAVIRAGRHVEAQQILMGRLSFEPDSVPNNSTLSTVYQALGLPEEAAATAARARMN